MELKTTLAFFEIRATSASGQSSPRCARGHPHTIKGIFKGVGVAGIQRPLYWETALGGCWLRSSGVQLKEGESKDKRKPRRNAGGGIKWNQEGVKENR